MSEAFAETVSGFVSVGRILDLGLAVAEVWLLWRAVESWAEVWRAWPNKTILEVLSVPPCNSKDIPLTGKTLTARQIADNPDIYVDGYTFHPNVSITGKGGEVCVDNVCYVDPEAKQYCVKGWTVTGPGCWSYIPSADCNGKIVVTDNYCK